MRYPWQLDIPVFFQYKEEGPTKGVHREKTASSNRSN